MKKQILILFLLMCNSFFAQTKFNSKSLFFENSDLTSFSFLNEVPFKIDYQKYNNLLVSFSIYKPKPGFNPTKIETQKYYSLKNTQLLLKREMSKIEPEPIFPDQERKKTFGEAIFDGVLNSFLK